MWGSEGGEELFDVDEDWSALVALRSAFAGTVGNVGGHVVQVEDNKLGIAGCVGQSEHSPQFLSLPLAVKLRLHNGKSTLVRTCPTQESLLGWTCLSK